MNTQISQQDLVAGPVEVSDAGPSKSSHAAPRDEGATSLKPPLVMAAELIKHCGGLHPALDAVALVEELMMACGR